ncbi:uncharacterized protein LOC119939478 isoform X1 [Tachyglossus aculeatus]|uniref:uncharacterized protein LOC119939478 isoform X1 n=1 Tax=Tachyglossus aculeatus TaxID=9261 RepID=UPI0018F329FC|nr:uncharacterized protein LOC119939478 isoform X1 [Tachyglossus aculeatus]
MEESAQPITHSSGTQKRKKSNPVSEVNQKLPKTVTPFLLLTSESEQDTDSEGTSGKSSEENLVNGEALDLSIAKQTLSRAVSRGESKPLDRVDISNDEDIGLLNRMSLSDVQKRGVLVNQWVPPSNFQFPKRLMDSGTNQKHCRCSTQLLQEYKFARYSPYLDGVFCGPCFVFNSGKEAVLVSTPLKDWSNGKKVLERHSQSKEHGRAAARTELFVAFEHEKKLTGWSRHALKQIVKIIIFCGRQNVLLGGMLNSTKMVHAITHYVAELDPVLKENLSHAPYGPLDTSEWMQSKLADLTGLQIQSRILERVKAATFFSLIADGSTDVSTKENIALSVRYVHRSREGQVELREDPIDFVEGFDTTERSLTELFLQKISAWGLRKELLRGYSYQGGSHMSGQLARICDILPEAVYSASKTHELNMAIIRSCAVRPVAKLLDTLGKVTAVLKWSMERFGPCLGDLQEFLDTVGETGEEEEEEEDNLQHLSWVDALSCFKAKYAAVLGALQKLTDDSGDAERLLYSITKFDFLMSLVCVEHVLACTRSLHLDMQRADTDLIHMSDEANLIIQRFGRMKDDGDLGFESLYDEAKRLADAVGVQESPPGLGGRSAPLCGPPAEDIQEGYRRDLFVPFLDHVISELQEQLLECSPRFIAQYLVPDKLLLLENDESEVALYDAFKGDISNLDSFKAELQRWRAKWMDIPRNEQPSSILAALQHLNPICYPNINAALSVLATMPISVPAGEVSSRALRRVRICQRNSVRGSRLPGLALTYVHQDIDVDPYILYAVDSMLLDETQKGTKLLNKSNAGKRRY